MKNVLLQIKNCTIKEKKIKNLYQILICIAILLIGMFVIKSTVQAYVNENRQFTQWNPNKKHPIYSVETEEKKVSISFDAAWGADDTDTLLSILEEEDVKATFFLCGYWIKKYGDEVKKIYEAGHDIGNHGDTHAHVGKLSKEKTMDEIQGAHDKIKNLLDIEMNLFRPPYGEYNNTVLAAAEELKYYTIQWDVDSHDWMKKGVDYEVNRVLNNKNLKNGSIVLFHNDTEFTPKTLPIIIRGLKEKGYQIVPISELIYKENYIINPEGRQVKNK